MILDFCAACGKTEDLHQHHIVPISVSGKKRNVNEYGNDGDMITLCSYHHDMIHEISKNRKGAHNVMIKEALEKKKALGFKLGRPTSISQKTVDAILEMKMNGVGVRETCRRLGIGSATYYNIIKHPNPSKILQKEKPRILYSDWVKYKGNKGAS
jgi:Mor family transcriptional regulator